MQKCYKTFYKTGIDITPGTLAYFKILLHRSNVNGKVKGRFQPHMDLLLGVGEGLIAEQFMEYFQMETNADKPTHPLLEEMDENSDEEKQTILNTILMQFMTVYGYGSIDNPSEIDYASKPTQTVQNFKFILEGSHIFVQPFVETIENTSPDDELYNYSMQLCHWFLHILELNDTAKEGDLNRAVLNSKYSIPFFYSHSRLSKYLVENVDYVLKTEYLLSPLQRTRVLEGSFVNIRGGKGNNVESDLIQEHSVCNQKSLIKSLGANKSERAISRATRSADTISDICSKFDESIHLKPKSVRHSSSVSQTDQEMIYRRLRQIRPFSKTPGRKCAGFAKIQPVPIQDKEIGAMKERINQIIFRLTRGQNILVDDQHEEVDSDEIVDRSNLPDL